MLHSETQQQQRPEDRPFDEDSWEEFFGTTTDLMPSIMGALDAIWEGGGVPSSSPRAHDSTTNPAKRTVQAHAFANLSPIVQKILSNVPDEELSNRRVYGSEESLATSFSSSSSGSSSNLRRSTYLSTCHKRPSPPPPPPPPPDGGTSRTRQVEISPNVRKMISNLPDAELLVRRSVSAGSFLHAQNRKICPKTTLSSCGDAYVTRTDHLVTTSHGDDVAHPKPLGSYLHRSATGIASRTPAGRKFLQVPTNSSSSESATSGSTSCSTTPVSSSEVSRPVSLTSLGSCSSSSSGGGNIPADVAPGGGPHLPSVAYLASAESLASEDDQDEDEDDEEDNSTTTVSIDDEGRPAPSSTIERAFPAGSADSGIAEQPIMSAEQCVLQEVVDTETLYVSDLREVIEGYLQPWRNDPDCPLRDHLHDLFSNLEEIYDFNRSFLEELGRVSCDPTLTANAFIRHDSGFSVYTEYCTGYPRTMTVLCELTGDDSTAGLFRARQSALGHVLPLGSYLLKPVQRILKYHLLLQRLSKQCDQRHRPAVELALATMTGVASHINTMKRKHEHAVRVQEIQAQLYGWTGPHLTALGELIAEGTFRVAGARARRHVFLFDKLLLVAKSKQDGYLAYKSHIMCSNLMLVEQVRGEPLSFDIIPFDNPRQQVTLRARSSQHKREWTLQLKRVILENYSAVIPNHARQLVMQLGQNLPDDSEYNEDASEKWSPVKQHSTPQYLERRSRFRKSNITGNGSHFAGRRSASQDRSFVSLASWRRKSEPGIPSLINQYTSKTLPKRICKLKKSPTCLTPTTTARFYTDLSDESTESLNRIGETTTAEVSEDDEATNCAPTEDNKVTCEDEKRLASSALEKVVSDLLMQNVEIGKLLSRQQSRKESRDKTEQASKSFEQREQQQEPTVTTVNKADSLPRDFQLNDQLEFGEQRTVRKSCSDDFATRYSAASVKVEDARESDNEHPDHRIYRKSTIRFSLVQRFRAIISEDQQHKRQVLSTSSDATKKRSSIISALSAKQSLESTGAKLAHPDYADPQKLFLRTSQTLGRSDASLETAKTAHHNDEYYFPTVNMSLDEHQVLDQDAQKTPEFETSFDECKSSQQDGGYEEAMERSLSEEDHSCCSVIEQRTVQSPRKGAAVRRPTVKAPPPPIPQKPSRLLSNGPVVIIRKNPNQPQAPAKACDINGEAADGNDNNEETVQSRGWVRTMVGRFE